MLPKQLWWNECDYKHNKRKNKALVQQLTHYERKTKLLHYQRAPGIMARDNVTDNGSNSSNTNIECYRRLDCMIDGGRRRSSIHRAAHAAVQLEQARQQLDGPTTASNNNIVKHNERQQQQPKIKTNDDIIRLAEIYSTYCMKSTIEAKRLGRIDAKEAKVAMETDWEVVNNIPTTGGTISTYDVNNNNNDDDDDNDIRKSVSGNSNSTSALSITPTTTQKSDTDNNCDKGTPPSLTATTTKMSTSSHDDNNNDNDDDIHNTTNGGGRIIVYQRYQAERRTNSTSRSKNHKRFKRAFTLLRMNPNRP